MGYRLLSPMILFALIIDYCTSFTASNQWQITVKQKDNEVNKVSLSYGLYAPVDIIFNKIGEEPVAHVSGTLKLSSTEVETPEDAGIEFDTAKATTIPTHIGRSCLLNTVEGQIFTVKFNPTNPELLIDSSDVSITVTVPQPSQLTVTQTEAKLSFGGSASYSISASIDPFMNVDAIDVTMQGASTNSELSSAENYSIPKWPQQGVKSKAYGIKGPVDYIVHSQKFTASIKEELAKCYKLAGSIDFSMKEDAINLINTQVKKDLMNLKLEDESIANDFKVTISSFKIFPVVLNCVMYCKNIGNISDEDIKENKRGTHSAEVLEYKRLLHETKDPVDLFMNFNSMSRLCLHTFKCIVTAYNIAAPLNFKSQSLTIGAYKAADIQREIKMSQQKFTSINCGVWEFSKAFNKAAFEAKGVEYFTSHIKPGKEEEKGDCYSFEVNKYLTPKDTLTTICLIPKGTCAFRHSLHYSSSVATVMNDLSSTDKIKTNLQLVDSELILSSSRHESDYLPYNYKNIEASISGMNQYYVTMKIRTKGNPAVCFFKEINEVSEWDFYEEDFYDPTMKFTLDSSYQVISVQTNHKLLNDKLITIYLNCMNFPNHPHYHHFVPYKLFSFYNTTKPKPIPDKQPLEKCEKASFWVSHCKEYNRTDYPAYGNNPILKFTSTANYALLDVYSKINYIANKKISKGSFSIDDLIALSLISHEVSLINCLEYPSFYQCTWFKGNVTFEVKNKVKQYTPDFLIRQNDYFKIEYANSLFFLSQNKDTLWETTGREFLDLILMHLKDFNSILNSIAKERRKTFLLICNGILNNVIDLLQYLELEHGLDGARSDLSTGTFFSNYSLTITSHIEPLLHLNREYLTEGQYPNFAYSFLNTSEKATSKDQMKEFVLNDNDSSRIEVPLHYFNEKNVDYLMVIVYSSYQFLMFFDDVTNKKAISIYAYDKDHKLIEVAGLQKAVNIHFGNNKPNDEMKNCGYLDFKTEKLSNTDMISQPTNDKKITCQTFHLSDFVMTKYTINERGLSVPPWVIAVSSIVAIALIAIVAYCIYLRYKPSKIEELAKDISLIKEENATE